MTYDGIEYDIVFNGAHGGQDLDLLVCLDRITEKLASPKLVSGALRIGQTHHGGRPSMDEEFAEVISALQGQPLTRGQLRARCSYTVRQVDVALSRCRRHGLLHCSQPARGHVGRPAVRYWIDPLG